MFYIWIAIAVAVWVFFGLSFYSDSEGTWKKIKDFITKPFRYIHNKIKSVSKAIWNWITYIPKKHGWKIFNWLMSILLWGIYLAIGGWIIYLIYLFIRWLIESDVYLLVIMYVWFPLAFMLFILFIKWIQDKISKK